MSRIEVTIDGENLLDEFIKKVDFIKYYGIDENLKEYLKNKVEKTYVEVMNEKLTGGTTMDEYISLYKTSYHIINADNGFILYNDALIPQEEINAKNKQSYPKGFSVAMAFEYGTGVVGMTTGNPNSWEYDKHNYGAKGWSFRNSNGEEITTSGFIGFEIFRYTADRVNRNLPLWMKEYYSKKGVI